MGRGVGRGVSATGNGLGVAPGELPPVYDDVDIFVQPGKHGGAGFFSTLGDAVAKGAKELQKSSAVRGLEKKAVSYGAKALRGAAEGALDGVADTVATAVGAPEASPFVDKLIDRGLSSLQKRGEAAIDMPAAGKLLRDGGKEPARKRQAPGEKGNQKARAKAQNARHGAHAQGAGHPRTCTASPPS